MTPRNEPFERTLRSWMAGEASSDGADVVHASVIEAVRRRPQRPTWLVALRGTTWDRPRGAKRSMPSPRMLLVLAGLAVSALGVGAIGGGAFRSDRGASVPTPSTSPPASAPASPAPTPRATPTVDMPAPIPSREPFDETIVSYLVGHGQSVTAVPGAVPDTFADAALSALRVGGLGTERYYVVVTCVDPSRGCAEVASTGLGDERGIWFIYNQSVHAIDAVTLDRILINGY